MKILVIIGAMLVAQVSASLSDVFQGAMLSVQNSFGKLFSDVVTDVKDTVDCTILAVEHVLSLSEDATARYYKKCGAKNTTQSDVQPKVISPILEISFTSDMNKEIPEIDARINETLAKYFNSYNPHDRLREVESELAAETQRLAAVNEFVRLELDRLSNDIRVDFSKVERRGQAPSVDSILDQLRVLEAVERNIRNATEADDIHRLIDAVLKRLHEVESSEALQNFKVDGVLKDLEKTTNGSYTDMRQRLEDWKIEEARYLDLIQNKMKEHEKLPLHIEYIQKNYVQGIQPNVSEIELTKFSLITGKPNTVRDDNYNKSMTVKPLNTSTKNLLSTTETTSMSSILSNPSNTESTKLAVEQFSNIPNIMSQQLTTNPIQTNDAWITITPVAISTRFYVNEPKNGVTERLNPQTIVKEQAFNRVPTNAVDIITLLTGKVTESISVTTELSTTTLKSTKSPPLAIDDSAKSTPVMAPELTTISTKMFPQVTSPLAMTTESTMAPPVTTSEPSTTPLVMTLQPTVSSPVKTTVPERMKSTPVTAKKPKTTLEPIMTRESPTSSSVMTPKPVTVPPVMIPKPTTTPVITPKPTTTPLVTTPEPTTTPLVTTPEPNTGSSEIQTTTIFSDPTSPSVPTIESTTSPTEIMTTSSATSFKSTTAHAILKSPFRELPIPTPSLAAFLDFVDRKEDRAKPVKRTTKMPANPVTLKPFHKPLPYARAKHSPNKSDLGAFLSHMPPSHSPSKSSYLGAFLSHTPALHPPSKPFDLSAFLSHMPRSHPKNKPSVPKPKPKRNNVDNFNSFLNHPSQHTDAHDRALRDARKLIEDSQRAHRLLDSIEKRKGLNAFNLPRSLNVGK